MATPRTNKHRFASYIGGVANPVAPAFTVLPAISGTARVGQVLTASAGTVTGTPTPTVDRHWHANGVAIPGAYGTTYTPVVNDIGKTITVRTRAQSLAGRLTVTSAATAAVIAA